MADDDRIIIASRNLRTELLPVPGFKVFFQAEKELSLRESSFPFLVVLRFQHKCLIRLDSFIQVRLGDNLHRRVHIQDSNSAVNDFHTI